MTNWDAIILEIMQEHGLELTPQEKLIIVYEAMIKMFSNEKPNE